MELSSQQFDTILKRLPYFEVSYESMLHKKLPETHKIGIAIPFGKKYFLWYTYFENRNVCFRLELNKFKKIVGIHIIDNNYVNIEISLGTIILVSCQGGGNGGERYFIEDMYYYKGLPIYKLFYSEKLGKIAEFLAITTQTQFSLYLPELWWVFDLNVLVPVPPPPYRVHHIQYRSLDRHLPYLNVVEMKPTGLMVTSATATSNTIENCVKDEKCEIPIRKKPIITEKSYKKPQYKLPTVFWVMADIHYDIYHLFACGKKHKQEYCGVAYIPTFESSIWMNSIFRIIRENNNLDYMQESDDEEDFQNIKEDKYVNLNKRVMIECVFVAKFKKWMPLKIANSKTLVVHIHQL